MAGKIKGITIEIGGDTQKLNKALEDVNKKTRDVQSELKQVERLLKLDPKNTELLAQKQKLLAEAVENTREKLNRLKTAQEQVNEQFRKGEINEEQYRAFQREVVKAEQELKKFEKQLKETGLTAEQVGKKLQDAGKKMTDIGKSMSMYVTAPIVAAGTASFKMAADLQDAMGATEQIYKDAADVVKEWADSLPSYYGIAEAEALEYANIMGSMLINIGGLSERVAAKQAQTLIELAGDLAAMYGGTTQDAVRALTGALKGNNTMLDNYGMAVNDATIKTKAFRMGLYSGKGEMSLAAKQAATLALIMEQTAAAQGQAAREAEGASGSIRTLTTEIKNLATDIGEILLPIIVPLLASLAEIVRGFSQLSPETQKAIVIIAMLAAAIGPLLIMLGAVTSAIGSIITFASTLSGILPALGTAFAALTGPVGLTVIAIAAAAAAIGYLIYQIVKNWDVIMAEFKRIFGAIADFFTKTVPRAINTGLKWLSELPGKVADIMLGVLNFFLQLPNRMFEIGANIVKGLWDGIKSMIEWIRNKISEFIESITGGFKAFLGIHSPSAVFADIGKNISLGLAQGIEKNRPAVSGAVTDTVNPQNITTREVIERSGGDSFVFHVHMDEINDLIKYAKAQRDLRRNTRMGPEMA